METNRLSFPLQFPELNSNQLFLRAITSTDSDVIFRLYADEKVMLQRGKPVFRTMEEAEKLIFHWRKLFAVEEGLRWGVVLKEKNKLIGSIGLKSVSQEHLRAETGYELDPEFWNRGIMTEALGMVCQYGFEKLGLHSIEANVTPSHIASKRILEKNGFTQEACYRENYFYNHWWDSTIYCRRK